MAAAEARKGARKVLLWIATEVFLSGDVKTKA